MSLIPRRDAVLAVSAFLLGSFPPIQRAIELHAGNATLGYDGSVWYGVATVILSGNATLYVRPALDNKPPVFQTLNLLAGVSGDWLVGMHLMTGLANGIAIYLLYLWCRERLELSVSTAVLSAALFGVAMPQLGMAAANSRSVAIVFLLGALLVQKWWLRGLLVAAAGLTTQWAIVGIPVMLTLGYQYEDLTAGKGVQFVLAGLAAVVISYAAVLMVFGPVAFENAIRYSLLGSGLSEQSAANLWVDAQSWLIWLFRRVGGLWYLFLPGLAGYSYLFISDRRPENMVTPAAYGAVYATPLLVKSLPYYFAFMMPFWSVLTVMCLRIVLSDLARTELGELSKE